MLKLDVFIQFRNGGIKLNQTLTEKQQALLNAIAALPKDKQKAVKWLLVNYESAAAICRAKVLNEAERSKIMDWAIQKNDDYLLVLALFERVINT